MDIGEDAVCGKAAPLLMAVLNITPDSFSDGGRFDSAAAAITRGQVLAGEGADILDVGGESTRPGHVPVDAVTEIARVVPVIAALAPGIGIPVSVDTSKAAVAAAAIAAGARMVNDVWGLQRDPDMAAVCADAGVKVVLMHNRAGIDPEIDIVAEMLAFLECSLGIARRAGIPDARIILDPGIGFGKTPAQSLAALRAVPQLKALGFRVLVGASRKAVIGHVTGRVVGERLAGTLAAHLWAVRAGADAIRAHDVAAHRDALAVWAALDG